MRRYQVKEVAQLASVSVRTLHYYGEIGLLVPSGRTPAGYRMYTDDDLLRLQQILVQRELGLPLEEIRRSLDDPKYDRREALLRQRDELEARATRTREMLRAIDRALLAFDGVEIDMKDLFQHETEAEERWGHTESWRTSKKRTSKYAAEDWRRIHEEQAAIYRELAALQAAGAPPDGDAAIALGERHRQSIDRWFYPCSAQLHAGLADLYESDTRFAGNIDKFGAGLTPYVAAAIRAARR